MPASYFQVPPDGSGKKLRTRQRVVSGNTIEEQIMVLGAEPTYLTRSGPLACAPNKYFLAFLNNAGSGQVLKLRRLYIQNAQLAAVTSGTAPATIGSLEFQVLRISAISFGNGLQMNPSDTADGSLTNYTSVNTPTSVTEGVLVYSWYTNNDEIGLTGGFPQYLYQQIISSAVDGWEMKEIEMNPGEGFCVKQITNFTLGSFDVLAVISKEL